MLKNLTSITATKRVALLLCILVLTTGIAAAQQGTGSGSGRGSGSGNGAGSGNGRGFGSGSGSGNGAGSGLGRSYQQSTSEATAVFRSARDLITDGNWAKAQEKFDEYVSSFPNEKNIDAALYWLAYAEHKLFKYDQCRSTIDKLLQKYPNSSWKDDARVLLAQVPGASAAAYSDLVSTVRTQTIVRPAIEQSMIYTPAITMPPITVTVPPQGSQIEGVAAPTVYAYGLANSASADDDDPCEFKIVVLQALFQTDVQRGIMAATEWLKPGSTQTVRCKSAALTLLGRNGGKNVTPVLLGVARSEPDLKLRARAISALGATNDDTVVDALRDFAMTSQDTDIVESSLYALSKHTGDRAVTVLSDFASNGSRTIAQRKVAIASISARPGEPAVDALFRIYDAEQNVEIRKAVIAAFGNRRSERAGNRLFEIARGSDNVEFRKAAINAISKRGGEKVVEFLLNLYDTEKNEELKDQILNSLGYGTGIFAGTPLAMAAGQNVAYATTTSSSRMSDQRVIRKLIEIARSPQAPMERRKRAIGWLSRSKDPEVLKFLEELLK